jgi:sporulation protein YabP
MDEKNQARHKLTLTDRGLLDVSGVINVEKFTDEDILLETEQGMLNIKGDKMHMRQLNLDGGFITVEGIVKSMSYSEGTTAREKGKGFLRAIFK